MSSTVDDKYIYIISTVQGATTHRYKVGKHTGKQSKLISRYKTPLINPIIYMFLPCEQADNVENEIKNKLKSNRVLDDNNRLSEWVDLPLCELINIIIEITNKYSNDAIMIKHEYNDDLIETILDNFNDDSDNSSKKYTQITNADEFMKLTDIKHIIITNKKTLEGYLKFENTIWRELSSVTERDDPDKDDLIGFLQSNNADTSMGVIVKYQWKLIIKDMANKFYTKSPKFYKFKYYEYVISKDNHIDGSSKAIDLLLNMKEYSFTPIPSDSIICRCNLIGIPGFKPIYIEKKINTDIIDELLNIYVKNKELLSNFKKLCQNIFISQGESVIYEESQHYYGLASWLPDFMLSITNEDNLYAYAQDMMKKDYKLEKIPRCVVVRELEWGDEKYPYTKTVKWLQQNGVKNIIIYKPNTANWYDDIGTTKYINDNYEKISKLLHRFREDSTGKYGIMYLLDTSENLFMNMVHWFIKFINV